MFFFTLLKTEPTVLENAIVLKRNKGAIFVRNTDRTKDLWQEISLVSDEKRTEIKKLKKTGFAPLPCYLISH